MDIVRWKESGLKVVGKRCDKCQRDWRSYRCLTHEFEMWEFTTVVVHAGYGAVHFVDGDRLIADLCQCCTSSLLGPFLRKLGNEFERELTPDEVERADELWFELLYLQVPSKTPRKH